MVPLFKDELDELTPGRKARIAPVPRSFIACVSTEWINRFHRPLVLVVTDTSMALTMLRDLQVFAPNSLSALAVPGKTPGVSRAPSGIHFLRSSDSAILVTTAETLGSRFLFASPGILSPGMIFDTRGDFLALLSKWGYQRAEEPLRDGEFMIRGENITLRLFGGPRYRLSFYGNTLSEITAISGDTNTPLERLEVPRALAEFQPSFFMDLIPDSAEIWSEDPLSLLQAFTEVYESVPEEARRDRLAEPARLHQWLENRVNKVFEDFATDESVDIGAEQATFRFASMEAFDEFLRSLPDGGMQVIAFLSEEFPLRSSLSERGIRLRRGPLSEGWVARFSGIIALTDYNFSPHGLGEEPFEQRLSFSHFKPGDLVVHEDHGIAIYRGLEHEKFGEVEKDYLVLEYEGGARLLLPVEHAFKVHRYIGVSGHIPILSRLGSKQWKQTLRRVREATAHEARELYQLYRHRLTATGRPHDPDIDWQRALESNFPYEETHDQRVVIAEVKRDMESPRPMDRLVIGDVGFGKTEIAVRAAFKAVMSGTQVAVLAPTTVLTYQHYQVFRSRMAPFPVEIALMSRFRTGAENAAVAAGLAEGKIDIVIGTHRLLDNAVTFKRLGLLIIDEEQRFGVLHKEKIKLKYPDVDVLTLSATPIPRTLYQSLIQIKSISYVRTPPAGRRAVITRAGPYSPEVVRMAVQRELDRGGRVFYLINRIPALEERANRLQTWFPGTTVAIAHGKLRPRTLENTIRKFIAGETRILVSTTLIENGVDIPGADTLIVEDAERYGLAELHQLRGRIGRSSRQAYAYFFVSPDKPLSPGARERLKAITRYSYLGAGFELSYRDLELRGAGELLGKRQHGFAARVGLIMYARSLGNALASLLGKKKTRRPDIEIPVGAYIPADYVPIEEERARIYEKILQAEETAHLEHLARELQRLHGRLPLPVRTLLDLAYIRKLAELCGVESVELEPSGKIAHFKGEVEVDLLHSIPGVRITESDASTRRVRFLILINKRSEALNEIRRVLERLQEAASRMSLKVI